MNMTHEDVIRSWKDEDFLLSLTTEQQAHLPANPAGTVEFAGPSGRAVSTVTSGQSICCISETGGCTVFCHTFGCPS